MARFAERYGQWIASLVLAAAVYVFGVTVNARIDERLKAYPTADQMRREVADLRERVMKQEGDQKRVGDQLNRIEATQQTMVKQLDQMVALHTKP